MRRGGRADLVGADIRSKLADMGVDVVASTPEAFSAYIRTELAKWADLIKAAGVKPE